MSESTPITNRKFASDDKRFGVACRLAGTEVTKRQASKFRRGLGLAYAAIGPFIGGYAVKRGHLQADLNKTKTALARKTAQFEGLDDPVSKEAKELSGEIEDLEQRTREIEDKLASLDSDFKILKG